jgi:hypothetical protein
MVSVQKAIIAAMLSAGCSASQPESQTNAIEWDSEVGLRVTLAHPLRVGEPLKIGAVVEPCEIDRYMFVNDEPEVAAVEVAPGTTWTVVVAHTHGSDLPSGTMATHKLMTLDSATVVRPTSAWLQLGNAIEARREW